MSNGKRIKIFITTSNVDNTGYEFIITTGKGVTGAFCNGPPHSQGPSRSHFNYQCQACFLLLREDKNIANCGRLWLFKIFGLGSTNFTGNLVHHLPLSLSVTMQKFLKESGIASKLILDSAVG